MQDGLSQAVPGDEMVWGLVSSRDPPAPCSAVLGSGPWHRRLCRALPGRAHKPCSELLCSLPPPILPTTPPSLKFTILRKTGVTVLYTVLFARSCGAGWWVPLTQVVFPESGLVCQGRCRVEPSPMAELLHLGHDLASPPRAGNIGALVQVLRIT